MILILSNKRDLTVDFVVSELRRRGGEFLRLNTEDLPAGTATICLPKFRILVSKLERIHDLTESVNVIWNRRPGKPFEETSGGTEASPAVRRFINDQWLSWLDALQLLSGVTWINAPHANDAMESKARQLVFASQIGFEVPDTIISNDPLEIRALAVRHGDQIVAKALYSPLIEGTDEDLFVFTNEIGMGDLEPEEEIRISPSIFQESLRPKTDYRVTVIGETVLAARVDESGIDAGSSIDWRTKKTGLEFSLCRLPLQVEEMCREFVRRSGLVFGAIDLVQQGDKFIFLEINPNGEWGWLQQPHGIPIAQALCDLMLMRDKRGAP